MASWLIACAEGMPAGPAGMGAPEGPSRELEAPTVSTAPWRIASTPDLGQYAAPEAQVVDFTIFQARDGTWQLIACVRYTGYPGETRLLYRWQAEALTQVDWQPVGVFMTSDMHPAHREGQLRAPHVIRDQGRYYLIYDSGGAAFVLESDDGKRFTRRLNSAGEPRFFGVSRDVMVLDNRPRDGRLYAYYTWVKPGSTTVGLRTAPDLSGPWTETTDVGVNTPDTPGDPYNFINAESPFVLFRNGYYYRWEQMTVFASRSPTRWPSAPVTIMFGQPRALYAPEVIEHDGEFFLAGYQYDHERQGVYMARFSWRPTRPKDATHP